MGFSALRRNLNFSNLNLLSRTWGNNLQNIQNTLKLQACSDNYFQFKKRFDLPKCSFTISCGSKLCSSYLNHPKKDHFFLLL